MSVAAIDVKKLRERTNAAMMDCKKALVETKGDIDKAAELLRKAGQAKADKKAGRTAAEGLVLIKVADDNKSAIMLEINSETDFVARDENFKAFAGALATTSLEAKATDVNELAQLTLAGASESVEQARQGLVAKIGENIQVRRVAYLESSNTLASYVHSGRIGVLIDLQGGDAALAKDIAMHIAASNPSALSREDVPEAIIAKEREIFTAQEEKSGKPAEIVEKIINGKINKFLDTISLLDQLFIKDTNVKISQLLKSADAQIVKFLRFEVGEGIEKKEENFAEEVMAQVRES